LFYLPEAHTDFVFAVVAEEFGFFGNLCLLLLYIALVFTAMSIGRAAEKQGKKFNGYLVYGLSVMLGLQAIVNMGVSSGMLPTKGLTLPLISYGGSSLIIVCVVLSLIMRADYENSLHQETKAEAGRKKRLDLEVTG
jgi:cell division protein FtsW